MAYRIVVSGEYRKTLHCLRSEIRCFGCGNKETSTFWFFCEEERILYCYMCCRRYHNRQEEHQDIRIDEIVIED